MKIIEILSFQICPFKHTPYSRVMKIGCHRQVIVKQFANLDNHISGRVLKLKREHMNIKGINFHNVQYRKIASINARY